MEREWPFAHRISRKLERAEADLRSRGAEVLALVCDVVVREQVERIVQAVRVRLWGP